MKFVIVSLIIMTLFTGSAIAAEKQCPTIKIPCSCSEAAEIFTVGLNNNPYKIELQDIEQTEQIGESCKNALSQKLSAGELDYSAVFKSGNRSSVSLFLNFVKTSGFDKSIRYFPIITGSGVCASKKISRTRAARGKTTIEILPRMEDIDGIERIDPAEVKDANCYVYLPHRFVAANTNDDPGVLNPMNTSYVISALIRSGEQAERELARNLIDNFVFEAHIYGYPLNQNRGYALTRSQNNAFPANAWEYFVMTKNYNWLENIGLPVSLDLIEYWNTRIGVVSLEYENEDKEELEGHRWFAHGIGPREEVWGPADNPDPYYFKNLYNLIQLALIPDPARLAYARGFDYNRIIHVSTDSEIEKWNKMDALRAVNIKNSDPETVTLQGKTFVLSGKASATKKNEPAIKLGRIVYTFTPKYFANERASLVSGYNPSHIYGPYNSFVDEFVDAAHNIQLYRANIDVAKMYQALADNYENRDKKKAKTYREKVELYDSEAAEIKDVILRFLWDKELGMIFNYSYHSHTLRSNYPFATGGYALWAELFDLEKPEEIEMLMKMVDYLSENLEGPAGYYASGIETGLAWDKPHAMPIHQGMIVNGLRKYSEALSQKEMITESEKLATLADRVALKYLSDQIKDWKETNGLSDTATMAAVWDLYGGLTDKGKEIFNNFGGKQR